MKLSWTIFNHWNQISWNWLKLMSNRAITFNSFNIQRETSAIRRWLFYWFCSVYSNTQQTDNISTEKLSSLLMLLVQLLPTISYYYKVNLWYRLRQYKLTNLANTFQLLNIPFFNCLFYIDIKKDWQKKVSWQSKLVTLILKSLGLPSGTQVLGCLSRSPKLTDENINFLQFSTCTPFRPHICMHTFCLFLNFL